MRKRVSLKWFVVFSFFGLITALVIGFFSLSVRFYFRGMDNIMAGNMIRAVERYVTAVPAEQRQALDRFGEYEISRDWPGMSERIRNTFKDPPATGVLLVHDESNWFTGRPGQRLFVTGVIHGDDLFYVSQRITPEKGIPIVERNVGRNLLLLVMISLSAASLMALLLGFLIRHVERPVKALGEWARSLSSNSLDETPPDFFYPELNDLAHLIRTSLSSVQESLAREQRFLRHSSHELRTPISVIRSNVELLHKLEEHAGRGTETPGAEWNPRQKQIIQRIDRASLTMKYVTETLLWLSRTSEQHLPVKEVEMEKFVRDLIEEARYLLKNKDVRITIKTSAHVARVSNIPARIVIGNLIRNAFQHTWSGSIRIIQQNSTVDIINDLSKDNDLAEDIGFGLGLQLIEQLTKKMNWSFSIVRESTIHRARVCFT